MKPIIYQPVSPHKVNQHYGDNIPCVKDFGLPTQHIVSGADQNTCPVGYEKLYPKFNMSGHNGTDLASGVQPVYASMDGKVIEVQSVPARGLGVGILSDEAYDFPQGKYHLRLRYWHLKTYYVKAGDQVKAGDMIGITDNTGYSSGNHLHFEGNLFTKDAGGHPVQYFGPDMIAGAINIEPYFSPTFAGNISKLTWLYKTLIPLLVAVVEQLQKRLKQ